MRFADEVAYIAMMTAGPGEPLPILRAWERPAWHRRAACHDESPSTFVTDRDPPGLDRIKALCAACAVQDQCLAAGLENDEQGVWGGMTRNERKRLPKIAAA